MIVDRKSQALNTDNMQCIETGCAVEPLVYVTEDGKHVFVLEFPPAGPTFLRELDTHERIAFAERYNIAVVLPPPA